MTGRNTQEGLDSHEIDQLDLRIIESLQENGRTPYREIAQAINVSEATVRYRIRRLIEDEIITISAFINMGRVKHENIACIELKVISSNFRNFLDILITMDEVTYISSTMGDYDIMIDYIYVDNSDLLLFLNMLKDRAEIKEIRSRTVLKIYKAQYPARVSSNHKR